LTKPVDKEQTKEQTLTHLAVIMDGNGRWARERGKSRQAGHRKGADNLRHLCVLCREREIRYLTVYAFSTENWNRPRQEVTALMRLFCRVFRTYADEMEEEGIRLRFMGQREGLPADVIETMDYAEETSRERTSLQLIIAFNYGGRREIVAAAQGLARAVLDGELSVDQLDEAAFSSRLYLGDVPDPDLIIRTGGESRLSNFLLWQSAYSELYMEACLWPDFGAHELDRAIEDYQSRQRRFGKI